MGTLAVTPEGLYAAGLVRTYFPESAWVTMVAVADAESGFIPSLVNPSSGATGLFQIEYWLHGLTQAQALNPIINTQTAARLYAKYGLAPWANDGYQQYLGIAAHLIALTAPPAPQAAPVVRVSATFGVSGSAHVTPGGRIVGSLRLTAHGTVPYRVTMSVSPSYGSAYPTSTTTTGQATNTTVTVTQSLVAPLPSSEIIRSHQLIQPGPVTFAYTVSWTVTDTQSGSTQTVSGGQRLFLTVQ